MNHFKYSCYILLILIFLCKVENTLHPTEHSFYSNQTKTELVVTSEPEYDFTRIKVEVPSEQITDYASNQIDLSWRHDFSLFHYRNYVLLQLKSFKHTLSLHHQLISILKKKNIWHQSSEEDPSLFA